MRRTTTEFIWVRFVLNIIGLAVGFSGVLLFRDGYATWFIVPFAGLVVWVGMMIIPVWIPHE